MVHPSFLRTLCHSWCLFFCAQERKEPGALGCCAGPKSLSSPLFSGLWVKLTNFWPRGLLLSLCWSHKETLRYRTFFCIEVYTPFGDYKWRIYIDIFGCMILEGSQGDSGESSAAAEPCAWEYWSSWSAASHHGIWTATISCTLTTTSKIFQNFIAFVI